MKLIEKILLELRQSNVELWVEGDRLRYRAPKEVLSAELIAQLRARKTEILDALSNISEPNADLPPQLIPFSKEGYLPLSFNQQRLWLEQQIEPGQGVYNLLLAYHLSGQLNIEALTQSLSEIIRRHSILRVIFTFVDGEPQQIITPELPLDLPIVDLQQFSPIQIEAEAQKVASEEARLPFDLVRGPIFRFKLLRLNLDRHTLLFNSHHIVSDGWSSEVFFRELTTLYAAFCEGKPSPLSELPIQYVDFAQWQRQWLQGSVLESQLNYWKQQLGGTLPVLQLPTDYPRPSVQSYRGSVQRKMLPEPLANSLKTLSKQSGCTLSMTLLAAFKVLLYRYSGQDDLIVGMPIAGRNQVEVEELIGFFVNTVALRSSLAGNPTFREVLYRVREVSLEAYANQDVSLEKLIEELKPNRDPSRPALFQVMFAMNSPWTNGSTRELPGMTIASTFGYVHNSTSKFDLTLVVRDTSKGVQVSVEYSTDLFATDSIARMLAHFQILLEGIVINPDQAIATLPLLTPDETHKLLEKWNATQLSYPETACIHQLIEAQVVKTPDATAVYACDRQLTYQELNEKANQLAHYLRSLGVAPDVPVALCVERSLEMVVGMIGILKAGGAYIPVDPTYPHERRAYMLGDAQPPIILTEAGLIPFLPEHNAQVVALDLDWEKISQHSSDNLASLTTSSNLAYIIYTSGSTGNPKGVTIAHQSMVNHSTAIIPLFELTKSDRVLQFSNISFDIIIEELFPSLICGATVVLRDRESHTSISRFLQFIQQYHITLLNIPTAFWHELVNGLSVLKQSLPASLRLIVVGGEKASRSAYLNWVSLVGDYPRWLNAYGPTETTVTATVFDPARCPQTIQQQSEIPIGRPIANLQTYVLDRNLQPVAIGLPGELYIGGVGLSQGYLNRPDLTADRFILNPFSENPESRLYKTGDVVRYLPDGNLQFVGRADYQVKIRGFRIEPAEIETVLEQHSAVHQSVICERENASGNKYLVAYLVSHSNQTPSIEDLRQFVKQKLPEYMVPATFVFLDALPMTPNGKVDRHALPTSDEPNQKNTELFITFHNEVERQLTQIWEAVLGVQSISIKDNFFDLGGHSLLAVRMFAQIEKTFGKSLPLATLFKAPTIEQLATVLPQEEKVAPWSPLVEIQTGGSKPPLFCIHGGGFNVLIYRDLAINLGTDRSVYGLQARGLDGNNEPLCNRIEDIAADYIKQIQTVQPEGPYFLAGLSSGGNIALEMAQQLHAQGQKVALLALFDSYGLNSIKLLPPVPRLLSSLSYALRYSVPRLAGKLLQLKPKAAQTKALEKIKAIKGISNEHKTKVRIEPSRVEQINNDIQHLPVGIGYLEHWINNISSFILNRSPWAFFSPKDQLKGIEGSLSHTLEKLEEAHKEVHKAYVPKVYLGRITLLRAEETPPGFYVDPQLGWGKIASGGLEIYKIPGHHVSIMESPVLAEKLRACLDKSLNECNAQKHEMSATGLASNFSSKVAVLLDKSI